MQTMDFTSYHSKKGLPLARNVAYKKCYVEESSQLLQIFQQWHEWNNQTMQWDGSNHPLFDFMCNAHCFARKLEKRQAKNTD